jgi:hypothetical protein
LNGFWNNFFPIQSLVTISTFYQRHLINVENGCLNIFVSFQKPKLKIPNLFVWFARGALILPNV